MTDDLGYLNDVVRRIVDRCTDIGVDPLQALAEKDIELELRDFFRSIPNDRLKDGQLEQFLTEVLGRPPDADLLERLAETKRAPRPSDDEILALELRQGLRCAICGQTLNRDARPHVDHVVPLALRGKSESSNYQLLCETCNFGKSKWIHWIMSGPFFKDSGYSISLGVRYAVLQRDRSRCTVDGCIVNSSIGALEVIPRIPVQKGGRLVFDNLRSVCVGHEQDARGEWYREALLRVRGVLYGAPRR